MIKKYGLKLLVALILTAFSMPGVSYATFEPSVISIDNATTGYTPKAVPDNLDAEVEPTTQDTSEHTLRKYVYTWNNSNAKLDDVELSAGGDSVPHGDSIVISTDTADQFANSDGLQWYLHVKTVYTDDPPKTGLQLSNDTIVGPYTFDNVAPTGTINLDPSVAGQTDTTVSGSPVTLEVSGQLADIQKVWVNSAENFATATDYDFSDPATSALEYTVSGTGDKTLHAWFEDEVGNRSGDAASLNFTIEAGKTMDPKGPLTLNVGTTQEFQIAGAGSESYTWTVVDSEDTSQSSDAATVSPVDPSSTAVLTAESEATVKVKAETSGADPLYSGVITVVKSVTTGDVNDDGVIDSGDAILVLRYSVGLITLTDAQKYAGNVTNKANIDSIDSGDAIKILRYSVGLITEF